MVRQAEEKMSEAEKLFGEGKYYDSKEVYRETWEYLARVEEEAARLKSASHLQKIANLKDACNRNISRITTAMLDVRAVEDIRLETVDDVVKGKARVDIAEVGAEVGAEAGKVLPSDKLREEYGYLEYIGSSGFADVYKVRGRDGGYFAIKVPRVDREEAEQIFFNELRKWEQLRHRNIVKLIKPRLTPLPHLVVEYVDGESLDKIVRKRKLRIDEVCRIAFDIASALEYAHSKRIIHCDLKPKNILVSSIGEAKITDFGLAKSSSSSYAKGLTLAYAAPEQVNGRADERTDVYQLGVIMYEMLTGVNPFDDADINKILNYMPEKPSKLNPNAEPLDEIVMRCLSKNAGERPGVREIREFLYEFMKKHYGESLHLTKDYTSFVRISLNNAFYAAKMGNYGECLGCLRAAMERATKSEVREEIESIMRMLENRLSAGGKVGEELLERMEMVVRMVERL